MRRGSGERKDELRGEQAIRGIRLPDALRVALVAIGAVGACQGGGPAPRAISPSVDPRPPPDASANPAPWGNDKFRSEDIPLLERNGIPKVVDLRPLMTPVKDQGDRDSCVAFAVAAVLEASIKAREGRDVDLSEEYLTYAAKVHASDVQTQHSEAGMPREYYLGILKGGLLREQDWGYQPAWFAPNLPGARYLRSDVGPPELYSHNPPPQEILDRVVPVLKGAHWSCESDYPVQRDTVKDEANHRLVTLPFGVVELAKHRRPFALAIPYNEAVGLPVSGDIVASPTPDALHYAAATGYDLERKVYFIKNSYGTTWGDGGYGTIPMDIGESFVAEDPLEPELRCGNVRIDPIGREPRAEASASDFRVTLTRRPENGVRVSATGRLDAVAGRFISLRVELLAQNPRGANLAPEPIAARTPASAPPRGLAAARFAGRREAIPITAGYLIPYEYRDVILWSKAAPFVVDVPETLLARPEVVAAQRAPGGRIVVRTTVAVYEERGGYRALAQLDTPLP